MASAPVQVDDLLAGLLDPPLPPAVSLWPETLFARITVGVVALMLLAGAVVAVRRWRAGRYRRAAARELAAIAAAARDGRPRSMAVADIAALVRRTVLAVSPRADVASLSGGRWLAFLDRSYGGDGFSSGPGRAIGAAAYGVSEPSAAEFAGLIVLVRHWIRRHHA